ncbi:hypothetical protein pipiens_001040 [Culex pipiens pipiens]|uniref:SET domain-containing protein n=1 Tax=Culex pipiens pipiens TaxID=38569 RepID=A0ABD1DIL1_CULPP
MEINIASLQDHILTRARGRPDVHEDFDFAIERYHREFLASTGGRKMDLESTWRHVLEHGPRVKVTKKEEKNYRRFMFTASIYFTVYMQSPAVRALIVTEDQQKFMLRCFMDYKQICLQASMFFWDEANAPLFPIASIINHSCDPNVYAIPRMSHFKMVALKPIAKGEQIFFSYGPVWYKNGDKAKQDSTMSLFLFQCDCVACNPARLKRWLATQKRLDEHGIRDLRTCSKVIADDLAPLAAKMNAVQQFIKKYAHTHPNESFCSVLQGFTDILYEALMNEWANKMRSEALEQVDRGL